MEFTFFNTRQEQSSVRMRATVFPYFQGNSHNSVLPHVIHTFFLWFSSDSSLPSAAEVQKLKTAAIASKDDAKQQRARVEELG